MKLNIQLFAELSETLTGTVGGYGGGEFYAIRSYTQNTEKLETTETIKLYLKKISQNYNPYNGAAPYTIQEIKNGDTTPIKSGTCSFNFNNMSVGSSVLIASATRTVKHDESTGEYPEYNLKCTVTTGTSSIGTCIIDETVSIVPIEVKYKVSIANFDLGQTPTINVNSDGKYTYNLSYKIGDEESVILVENLTTNTYIWTLEETLENLIKDSYANTKEVPLTIICETFDGEASKGTSEANAIITIKDRPGYTGVTKIEQNTAVNDITGGSIFIKGLSNWKITLNYSTPRGTTLKKYIVRMYINSQLVKEVFSENNELIINNVDIENNEATATLEYECIDNRGNSSILSGESGILENINYLNYIKSEYIDTECTVNRNESNIDALDILLKGNYYNNPINNESNELTLGYKFREYGSSGDYITGSKTLTPTFTNNIFSLTATLDDTYTDGDGQTQPYFDHTKNYEIVFTIKDKIYIGQDITKIAQKSQYIMFEHENGVDFLNATILGEQVARISDLSNASYAQLATSGKNQNVNSGATATVNIWGTGKQSGDFIADVTNQRIVIKNAELILIYGHANGGGYCNIHYNLTESDGTVVNLGNSKSVLYQYAGNGYFSAPTSLLSVPLDKTKTYYLQMQIGGYNGKAFSLGNGFNGYGTFMEALKIA